MYQFVLREVATGRFTSMNCASAEEAIEVAIVWNRLEEHLYGVKNAFEVYDALNEKVIWVVTE